MIYIASILFIFSALAILCTIFENGKNLNRNKEYIQNLLKEKIVGEEIDITKPSKNRRFVKGDVVLFNESGQQYDSSGYIDYDIEPYTRTGIMLIGGFDYDSDIACRAAVGRSAIGKSGTIYGNFAPCGHNYRRAKKHHIKKFIKELERNKFYKEIYKDEIKILKTKL